MAARAPIAAALGAVLLGGCVSTRVVTDDPRATIWFDGRPVGRNGKVWSVGPPHTARVLVVASDGRRARALVEREFSWFTFAAGLRTLGVCFALCWTYPPDVLVPLPPPLPDVGWDVEPAFDPWEGGEEASAWMRAPGVSGAASASVNAPTGSGTGTGTGQGTRETGGGVRAREPGHVDGHGHDAANVPIDEWSLPPSGATP